MLRLRAACLLLAGVVLQPILLRAEDDGASADRVSDQAAAPAPTATEVKNPHLSVDAICRTLAKAAADNDLPEEFFTRLIWQESRFDPNAVSPAGAQGIAQFMPQTAAMRGLINAFEPLEALRESASYLRELRTTFRGNLGLAAAAYNAGPSQVEAWLAGRRRLPYETQAYVRIVTGHSAEAWASQPPPKLDPSSAAAGVRCVELAKLMMETPHRRPPLMSSPAWGHGVCSLPATGPRVVCWRATNGCDAGTLPCSASDCRWSCSGIGGHRRGSWFASRRAAGRKPKLSAGNCGPRAAPASSSAIRAAETALAT